MFRFCLVAVAVGVSFPAGAANNELHCTGAVGYFVGQSTSIVLAEKRGHVITEGGTRDAKFSKYSIEWRSANGGIKYKLDRLTGNLYIQVEEAKPFALAANCVVSPTNVKF